MKAKFVGRKYEVVNGEESIWKMFKEVGTHEVEVDGFKSLKEAVMWFKAFYGDWFMGSNIILDNGDFHMEACPHYWVSELGLAPQYVLDHARQLI